MYRLYEIGYDSSIETGRGLIEIAQFHCVSYDDGRQEKYMPIRTVKKAIEYFNEHGFEVTKV